MPSLSTTLVDTTIDFDSYTNSGPTEVELQISWWEMLLVSKWSRDAKLKTEPD